jgi:dipeptidyl aminopeptidase/acylaminoacyl peptidase
MEQLPTTIDKLIELEVPASPKIAPDGQHIAYTVTKPDWKEDSYVSQIWLVKNEVDAESCQLTFSKNGSSQPRWSPDGKYIAFLSKREGDEGMQIYRLSVQGGEAERLTELKTDIGNLQWSPDGQAIAFSAVMPETAEQKSRKERYGDYVEDNVDYQHSQMWLLTLADKKLRQLTTGTAIHVREFEWHPDSKRIAVCATPSPDMNVLMESRIYLLDVESLAIRPLTPLPTFSPQWSPDGQSLVYERGIYNHVEGSFYKNSYLEIMSLIDETTHRLDMDFDENPTPIGWAQDGIYFWSIQRTNIHLFRVSVETCEVVQVTPQDVDGFVAMEYSFNQDYTVCGLGYADSDRFWEIASIDLTQGNFQTLTNYDKQTHEWELPRHELYRWKSTDGTEIEGVLTKPLDFDPSKQYPLLVAIHGGPSWVSLRTRVGSYERRLYPIYQWVSQGAIVLQPNYRGSAGYGEVFRSLNVRDLGTGDYADVISGVDALIAEGWIDSERVGAMGWSQGGYISMFITTYSDRFKAISAGAGISNWMTYYVNTDIHPFTISYLQSTPWDDPEIYAKTSPMTYIKNAKTPTLIQHGEKDGRVPLPNAFELHQGLLDQGVESKLVVYPGMPHGPGKPKQSRHIMNDNFEWFNRHIFGIEADKMPVVPLYIVVPGAVETQSLVRDVAHLARRDGATYRVLAADGTLTDEQPTDTGEVSIDDTVSIVTKLIGEITEIGTKKITVYTEKVEDNSSVLVAVGCVQIAAGSIGGITVVHHQGDV